METQTTSAMQLLRSETKTAHQQLERATLPYIKAATNDADYAKLLRLFYGYFMPVEELINQQHPASLIPDYAERRKAAAVTDDLKTAGAWEETIPQATQLPHIHDMATALGALYVLEGSTLGGQIISKMLAKQLQRDTMEGISFFSGYGAATQQKWLLFSEAVSQYTATHSDIMPVMINAANETFACFENWVAGQ